MAIAPLPHMAFHFTFNIVKPEFILYGKTNAILIGGGVRNERFGLSVDLNE